MTQKKPSDFSEGFLHTRFVISKLRPMCTPRRVLLPLVLPICAAVFSLNGCYSDLEDEEKYSSVAINTDGVRAPNSPPGAAGTPTGTTTTPVPTMSSPPSGFMFTPGCEDVVTTVFANAEKCGGALCHGGPGTKPIYLDLGDSMGIKDRVYDKPGAICSMLKLVDPMDPTKSAILHKLEASPTCGQHMPVGRSLTAEDANCIKEWVTAMAAGEL